jgi:hypothetical protein
MIHSPNGGGPARNLARWDYSPEQALAAKAESPDRFAMRFRLQLPENLPTDQPAELWVRLIQDDGSKVLAKAPLTLNASGSFASTPFEIISAERTAEGGVGTESSEVVIHSSPTDEGWAIAKPGETVVAVPGSAENTGGWRVATQPMPEVVSSPVVRPVPPVETSAVTSGDRANARARAERAPAPISPPTWSADRDGTTNSDGKPPKRAASGGDLAAPQPWSPLR